MWETAPMTRLALALVLGAVACGGSRRPAAIVADREVPPPVEAAPLRDPAPAVPVAEPPPTPITPPSPPAPPPPPSPNPATLAKLEWPATTRSFVLRRDAHAYAGPDLTAEVLGKIVAGTRLPVGDAVDGDKRCEVWLAAMPRGWVCARHAKASAEEPLATTLPVVPPGHLVPKDYYNVAKGAARYANADAVRAGTPLPEPKHKSTYMVTRDEGSVEIDGLDYVKTSVGWVAETDLTSFRPSTFAGVDLVATPPPAWPFAWVYAADRKKVVARTDAAKKAPKGATFAHRALVPVLEERDGFVRVADGQWIARKDLRVARTRPRPAIADAHAKWIDLDRDEQVMIAYDGDTPVFATLFSSGRRKNDTPPAIYRIRSKSALTKMSAEERESSFYEVSEVPWATRFRSGLYFHAAYWHDRFGQANSHGCVNLSAADARWVYDWTEPVMPAGWSELEVPADGAMVVRVHDARHPDPPVFDYVKESVERAKIRKREERLKRQRLAAEAEAAAAAATPVVPVAP
jgi:lipoprotein-anchoring transpeptidase ErfK/SrfK